MTLRYAMDDTHDPIDAYRTIREGIEQLRHEVAEVKERLALNTALVSTAHEGIIFMAARRRNRAMLGRHERLLVQFMVDTGRYLCPCCEEVPVIGVDGVKLPGAVLEHRNGPQDNSIENLWLVDGGCNVKLKQAAFHEDASDNWRKFQRDLRRWLERQVPFGSSNNGSGQPPLFPQLPRLKKVIVRPSTMG